MKTLPKILTVGTFEPCNLVMSVVEYEAPLSKKQRSALIKRTKRFCTKHCSGSWNRVLLEFDGSTIRIKQYAASAAKPFTKFHFAMLLNQKLGGPIPDKVSQEPAKTMGTA